MEAELIFFDLVSSGMIPEVGKSSGNDLGLAFARVIWVVLVMTLKDSVPGDKCW